MEIRYFIEVPFDPLIPSFSQEVRKVYPLPICPRHGSSVLLCKLPTALLSAHGRDIWELVIELILLVYFCPLSQTEEVVLTLATDDNNDFLVYVGKSEFVWNLSNLSWASSHLLTNQPTNSPPIPLPLPMYGPPGIDRISHRTERNERSPNAKINPMVRVKSDTVWIPSFI